MTHPASPLLDHCPETLPRAAYLVGFQEIDPAQVQVRGIAPQTAEITS